MGQGNSRSEPGSPERQQQEERRSAVPRPTSTIFENSRSTALTRSTSRRRRYSTNLTNFLLQRSSPDAEADAPREEPAEHTGEPLRRRSRLSRASSSFTNNIPSIFVRHASPSSRLHDRRSILAPPPVYPYRSPTRAAAYQNSGSASMQAQPRPESDLSTGSRPTNLNPFALSNPHGPDDDRTSSSLADRISSLTPDRGFRNRTAPLRRRRSPLGRTEDQSAMLHRLLSVVAAATAATLMGNNPETAMSELRNATGDVDGDDGTFNGFLQALRNGRLTSGMGQQEHGGAGTGTGAAENPASLEFFRMFRFGSSSSTRRRQGDASRPSSSRSTMSDHASPQGHRNDENGEHRMVPILIVGIRALNGDGEGASEGGDGVPSFLDALTSVPANFNMELDGTESLLRAHDDSRTSQRRRASLGGLNLFSSGRDALRNARLANASRSRSEHQGRSFATSDDSPLGPHPPPTTPASAPLSAMSSGTSSPAGRSSYSRRESFIPGMTGTGLAPTTEESSSYSSPFSPLHHSRPPRHRRLSDSDTPRFGSGSSRRNGVLVEPHPPLDEQPFSSSSNSTATDSSSGSSSSTASANTAATGSGNRSWIIYILGGSYPENHPILSTPSLFTDTPTYEDMLLLSSLLGPAKPPVASAEEVAEAPGILTIKVREDGSGMSAVAVGEDGTTVTVGELANVERCLVCLCNYEDGEEARRLVKCGHLFHRECIDQWLTTGRNSCPLCRGQGVDEKARPQGSEEETAQQHGSDENNVPIAI